MKAGTIGRALAGVAVIAAVGCGSGGGSSSDTKTESQDVIKSWITAAVEQDGTKYCESFTKDALEKLTSAQSDQAMSKCEQLVKDKPLRVFVAPGTATEDSGESTIEATIPKGAIKLRKEDDKLKIDSLP
jgi:hypothetical protein